MKSHRWVTREHFDHAAKVCNNWGKWGAEDQIGTLNYITPESIIAAAKLVRRGAPFPLSIPLDNTGPQEPNRFTRRHNPVHTMLATGADVVAGVQLLKNGSGYADCAISLREEKVSGASKISRNSLKKRARSRSLARRNMV